MAKTKRPKRQREKTRKELTAAECVGSLRLAYMVQGTLLRQLKKRIELEKPAEVDDGPDGIANGASHRASVSTSAFSRAEAPDSPELQR